MLARWKIARLHHLQCSQTHTQALAAAAYWVHQDRGWPPPAWRLEALAAEATVHDALDGWIRKAKPPQLRVDRQLAHVVGLREGWWLV